ncbi:hypothetical protein WHR41_03986 [Cladosporium halotolerans]|uniref:Uncharacterized protein n=1 Tax=Cladosporium halotolerans TaxID=1052096 RepID=A0AB34KT35_9PEZI
MQRFSSFIARRREPVSLHPLSTEFYYHEESSSGDSISLPDISADNAFVTESVTTFASARPRKVKPPRRPLPTVPEAVPESVPDCAVDPQLVFEKSKDGSLAGLSLNGIPTERIDIRLSNGERVSWRNRNNLRDLPADVRKEIWREAFISDKKLFICACTWCRNQGANACQPPLTRTCRAFRAEALPIFYGETKFKFPVGHTPKISVPGWLKAIRMHNSALIRHLELAFFNAEHVIKILKAGDKFKVVSEVSREVNLDDDGVERLVFTATRDESEDESDASTVGTSILSFASVFR